MRSFSRTALSAAVAIVVAAPALAQNTTAAIGGQILGSDGKPVAGAVVSIVHKESGSSNKLTTDADGRYSARGLRVGGPYTIVVTKGNEKDSRDDVYLQLAENLSLNLTLGTALSTVVVTGAANNKFNSASMGSGTNMGRKELDAFASIGRNLQDYARTDPRLAQTDKERGEISAGGQNTRYNSITIDGVRVNDTFGLESNNLPTTKQPISIDAIQSVQVNLSNYDVTQQGYTGANINAVTKSGTNELKGSVYYVYRNDKTGGDRVNPDGSTYKVIPYKEDTKGFTLGGPIVEDKLFFFTSYEELKSSRAQPGFGPVGSDLTNVGISQAAINALKTNALSKYGFDVGDVMAAGKLTAKDYLLKLDWNINDQHRANVRFTRTEQLDTNNGAFGGYSATGLQMTSQWWDQSKKIDTLVAQWFADWTPNFSTEVKLSNRLYNSVPLNSSNLPAMAWSFAGALPQGSPAGTASGTRFLNFGTEQSRHFNVLDTKTINAYAGATWNLDAHEVKFGVDMDNNKVYNAFFQNTNGNYTFNCTNSSATFTYAFGSINCSTANAAQVEAAVLENFLRGRPSSYQVQLPVAGGTLDSGIAQWTLRDTGYFLQDTWTVNKQLTLTAGVRLDQLKTGDKPQYNAAAAAPRVAGSVSGTTVVRNTGGFGLDNSITVDGQELVQPRFGFNYALDNQPNQKSQVRGGFGLFQGAAANVWLSNPYSNTGLATRIVGCGVSGFSACPGTGGIFSADPLNQPTNFVGATPAANVDFVASGLGQPSVWKANLAWDVTLPGGFVLGAEWLGTKNRNAIYYQHLNLGDATRTGVDGRQMFWTPQTYDPSCWSATGSLITSGNCAGSRAKALGNASFNNVLLATKTSEGGGNAITLSLSGPRVFDIDWNVAYTRTDATEVSPLTSSVANSNFNSRSIFNPNEEVASNSAYLIKDRVNASLNWSKALLNAKYKTSFGLFYEGRAGKPYSWTYANDLNGDGVSGNDLMYIPKGPQSGEVVFVGDTATSRVNEDRFWSVVNANSELADAKGGVVKRNASFSPIVHNFDLRISQEMPGFHPKHKGVISLDILNVGNLLNKEWGRINEPAFSSGGGVRRSFVNFAGIDAQGRYVYSVQNSLSDYELRQLKGESQWAAQITMRYEF